MGAVEILPEESVGRHAEFERRLGGVLDHRRAMRAGKGEDVEDAADPGRALALMDVVTDRADGRAGGRGRDEHNRLETFFLVAHEALPIDGNSVPTAYLGLSAARQDLKNTGLVRQLYVSFLQDAGRSEGISQQRLLLWYTTATPSAYFASQVLFDGEEPSPDGGYSEEGAIIAGAIRIHLGAKKRDGDHPFVLREIATATRYSSAERQRIQSVIARRNVTILTQLGVIEQSGDRLLVIARVPEAYRGANPDAAVLLNPEMEPPANVVGGSRNRVRAGS